MTIKEQAEIQTPNAPSTELYQQTQMNKMYQIPQNTTTPNTAKDNQEIFQAPNNSAIQQNNVQPTTQPNNTQYQTQQNQVQQNQNVAQLQYQQYRPNTAIKIPSDLYDVTVEGYLNEYRKGQETNDFQAQINALNAIDSYRTSQGYAPIYSSNVYELINQRTEKIKNAIREYETDMANAMYSGNEALAQQIGQQMEDYKKSVNYQETMDNASNYLANIEYKSTYDTIMNNIINELLTSRFTYDPNDDQALLKAQKYATNTVYESMNAKGILDSTMTAQIVTKTVNDLIPVYEKMAKEDFYQNVERLQSMANLVMNLDEVQYNRWKYNVQTKLDYYSAKKDEIDYQWDRVNKLGYVDNEASIVLGVAPGTMSPSTREAIQEAEREAQSQYDKLYSDIKLAEAKANIEANLYQTKKSIDNQYGGTNKTSNKDSSTIYNNVSDSDKKKIIKTKYNNGEISELEAIEEIYNNFESSKVGGVLSDILGMSEKVAKERLINGYANELVGSALDTYGEITKENVDYFDKYAVDLYNAGEIDEATLEEMLKVIDQGLGYNNLKTTYLTVMDSHIKEAKKLSRKELKKKDYKRTTVAEDLLEKVGRTYYDKLEALVKEKEKELEEVLKEKGIDW